ncbi:hypothetical protein GC169_07935 [bacterium]|nr:hypothetical protein [bacterium]
MRFLRLAIAAVLAAVGALGFGRDAVAQDFPPTAATTCVITPGGAVSSAIETSGDVDWCRFTLEAGRNHSFQVQVAGQPGQTLTLPSAEAQIFTADGDKLAPPGNFPNAFVDYTAPVDGTAYVDIRGAGLNSGTYRLVMRARDLVRADIQTSAIVAPGTPVNGELEGTGDSDWYRVQLREGLSYAFRALGQEDDSALSAPRGAMDVELRNASGALLLSKCCQTPEIGFVATQTGDHFIAVRSASARGSYRLISGPLDDAGETVTSAIQTAPGRTLAGSTEVIGDRDAFRFSARSGERYRIVILGAGVDNLTNTHVCIELFRPSGTEFTFQCSGGASSAAIEFTTDAAGDWIARTFTRFDATGTYRVLFSGRDDFGQDLTTIGRIDPGFFANGTTEAPGDNDWFKVNLTAGVSTRVRIRQAQSGVGSLGNSRLYILDPSGQEVASDIGGGNEPDITFTPAQSGEYVIRANGFCLLTGVMCFIGTYRVEVTQGSSPSTTTTIAAATLPQARSVRIGDAATFFGTILNTGNQTATKCGVQPSTTTPARFTFTQTNSANQVIGQPNTRFDIPAGQAGGFVLSFDPGEAFAGTPLNFVFDCANTDPAPIFAAVNGFTLSASNEPVPDVIMVAATPSNDGIANIPGPNGTGFFSTAAVNIGAPASITFQPQATTAAGLNPLVCETNATTGQCLGALTASVTRTLATGETAFFSVFFGGGGQTVPFDPANRRVNFFAQDPGGAQILRGSTSVAVRTQ